MATASCQNTDCERDHEWTLTKHPADYSGSGPTCPDCGTTNVDIQYEGGEQSRQGGQPPQQRQQQGRGQQAPARQQPQQQGGLPATGEAGSAGDTIAQGLLALGSDEMPTRQKAGVVKNIGTIIADTAGRYMTYRSQVSEAQSQRAKEADLQKVEANPECECGHVFTSLPDTERVTCPDCGVEYEIVQ